MNEAPLAPMSWRDRIGIAAILTIIVAVMFYQSFKPELVHFSSDGPLGILASKNLELPEGFKGIWFDTNWLGASLGVASPTFTFFMMWILGPVGSAKFLAAVFVLSLGLASAFAFRLFGFRPMVCLLAGIAAELNSNFFSNACWGVGSRCSSLAATFLALAAIWSSRRGYAPLKLILAGFATGMAVAEGGDNGAIFSLYVAAFAFYVSLIGEGTVAKKIIRGITTVAIVAVCAGAISYSSIKSLIGTQITGKVGTAQTVEAKQDRWYPATQWSLPKIEILRVIVPGLFGYRMDTPEGGEYWGRVGEWAPDPRQSPRSSGAGEYAGVLVVLVAAWALARSFSRAAHTFSTIEKRLIWFWAVMCVISVLFAWGRHAPFYQMLYALPYFSTIRNPMKFMHPGHMTLMILFAYGLHGLAREYLDAPKSVSTKTPAPPAKRTQWEKFWTYGCIGAVVISAIGWMAYSSYRADLVRYMTSHFVGGAAPAAEVARFSIREVGIFVLVLAISVAAVLALQAGIFRGAKAPWAGVFLGLILFADLARANAPWVQYYDYKTRYASNPVIDILKEKRWEHRVAMPPFQLNEQFSMLQNFYRGEWLQHQFQFYNIQTLDVTQEPKLPYDKEMVLKYVGTNIVRYWQLTNTRYLFGIVGLVDMLNQQLDPVQKRFRQYTAFTLFRKPDSTFVGAETNAAGPFALIEFTGALPRARLYPRWIVSTNDVETLSTLGTPAFNPEEAVFVNDPVPGPEAASTNAPAASTVEYTSYEPKHFIQNTSSDSPGLLLVNDHYDPDWKITIDGKPAPLLHANFVMRGVRVPAGKHTVVWRYLPSLTPAYVSWAVLVVALMLCGVAAALARRSAPRKA